MAKSFSNLTNKLPVDYWLSMLHNYKFDSLEDAEKFEAKLFFALKERHLLNLKRFLPAEYSNMTPELISGLQIFQAEKGKYQIRTQYCPSRIDQMVMHLPTGHPSNPSSFYILCQFHEAPELTYHSLKIKREA